MDSVWKADSQTTIVELLDQRLEREPDSVYLDVCGTEISAADVAAAAGRLRAAFADLGVTPGARVATLLDTCVEAIHGWYGTVSGGAISVPINTAYKGDYLHHQLHDCGARVIVVQHDYLDRLAAVADRLPALEHVVVVGGGDTPSLSNATVHTWDDVLAADPGPSGATPTVRPSDVATFIYTGGTTGPSKGCMVSHNYNATLARQINICWRRTAEDVAWVPLPLFHFNVYTTAIVGTLLAGGRSALYPRFSVSNFWPEMNRTSATVSVTLGSMAYMLAHDDDRPEMPRSGSPNANTTLRLMAAAPMPAEIDQRLRQRFGVTTFSGAYGLTEASLVSWQPLGVPNKPGAAGVVNDEYFDVRIFDDDDNELARGTDGEIVVRPKRAHAMFEGYWGNPQATVDLSRNWWFHTGDIGRVDEDGYLFFVDRKKDYLRRRGENISSQQVEATLLEHEAIKDVAVHAVPSDVLEDDLKVTAVLRDGATVTEEDLFRWCIDRLPYFAVPRYIEFRADLPRSPVGRVLKRDLRDDGVTPATWDSEAAGIAFERR